MSVLDRMVRDIEGLKTQMRSIAGGPQLALSSIENGAIDSKDADGNLKMTIGLQDDGGNTINVLNGPTPPTPVGFTVEVDHGKFILHWFGEFDGDALAPSDWSRAEVHASQDPFFVPSRGTARGSIVSAAGGEVTIGVLKGPWTIKMVAWSQAGKMSVPSAPATVEVPGYGDIVLEEIDAAQTRINNAREILVEGQETLGEKLDESEAGLEGIGFDLGLVQEAQETLEGAVSAVQVTADAAQQAAWDADSKAVTAKNAADAAATAAASAAGIANGKAKVLYQSPAPGAVDRNVNTLWIDTTGGANTPKRWTTGTTWVAVTDKAATDAAAVAAAAQTKAEQAKTAADNAQSTADAAQTAAASAQTTATQAMTAANSKNRITRSTANPPTNYDGRVDDVWWKMSTLSSGGRVLTQSRWNGSTWLVETIDSAVLAYVDAAKITTGFLDVAALIRAGAITAEKLLIGGPLNLISDPQFAALGVGWVQTGGALSQWGLVSDDGVSIEGTATGSGWVEIGSELLPARPGDSFVGEVDARVTVAWTSTYPRMNVWFYDANRSRITPGSATNISGTSTAWSTYQSRQVAPSGTAFVRLNLTIPNNAKSGEKARFRNPRLRSQVNSTLIEPGGIQTPHLAADVLEVGNLKAGTAALAEAVIAKLFAEVVVAKMVQAEEFIGENAILDESVTAPKIVASEELWAKLAQFVTVRAEMVDADVFIGRRFEGVDIVGSRFTVLSDEGDIRTQLSPEGNTFKGEVEADTLVVNGGAEFRSVDNMLAQGAKLTLAAGVTDPTAPPTVQPYWEGVEFDTAPGKSYYGLAFAGGKYWTFEDAPQTSDGDRIVSIDPATGAIGDAIPMTSNFWAAGGMTAIGSELFLLGPKTGTDYKYFVRVYSTAGVFLREWEYTGLGYSKNNPLRYKPGIGNDGTNVVIAQCSDDGSLTWSTYNKTSGAKLAEVAGEGNTSSDITGIHIGPADWGGGTFVTVTKASTGLHATFTTAGAYDTTRSWYAEDTNFTGIVFADGHFRSLNQSGVIREYANATTGDGSGDWWCAYRWETDTDSNGTIDYRSKISPPARFTWPRRAQLKATGQPKPAGVELMAGFLAKKSTKPSRTDFKRNYTSYSTTRSIAYWDWYQNTGDAPADGNTYPAATPSSIASASSTFQVRGDGSGKWGPLTFNPDGTMTGVAATGRVTITPTSANTPTSATVTFPVGRFGTPPIPSVTNDSGGTSSVTGLGATNVTATSMTIGITRTNTNPTPVWWTAVAG